MDKKIITSTGNSRIRNVINLKNKAKERREQDLFLVEGIKMFLEAPAGRVQQVYMSESFFHKNGKKPEVRSMLETCGYELVSDAVFEAMSDTRTPQGVICLIRQFHYGPRELTGSLYSGDSGKETGSIGNEQAAPSGNGKALKQAAPSGNGKALKQAAPSGNDQVLKQAAPSGDGRVFKQARPALIMVLEDLQDPGNLGTIIRTAEGAGVTGILLSSGCVDIYNPKVIRSTMGSVYRVPFAYTGDLKAVLENWKQSGIRLYAAHLAGKRSYDLEDYSGPSAFLIGNESRGLSDETAGLADHYIRIPMLGQVESLNAGVASALLMYEAARQRRGTV